MFSALDPLRHPPFRRYWLAGLAANFGWQIQLVGASWLMIQLGGSATQVALVQTFVALPVMLLSLPGGALTDRIGQRAVVIGAQVFLLGVSAVLAAGAWAQMLSPALLLAFTLLLGAGRALYYPGWQSMVLEFFDRPRAPAAFAINTGNLNIARSLGPALGGAVVAGFGAFLSFVLAGLSTLAVLGAAHSWPRQAPAQTLPPEPLGSAIVTGIRYMALSPALRAVTLRSFVFNVGAIAPLALLPLVARDLPGGGPEVLGLLLGAFGAGAVMAAFAAEPLRRRFSLEQVLAGGFVATAAGLAGLAMAGALAGSLAASGVLGAAWILVQVSLGAANQIASARWVISRSIALYQTFVFGGNALGSLIWGLLAQGQGLRVALLAAGVSVAAGVLLGLFARIRLPDLAGLDPQAEWAAPTPRIDMVAKSGPILTTITYRIAQEDIPAFLAAMTEKRLNRLRDGAASWTLSRDILDPDLWFERFRVSNWADAQRLHARRTVAGGQVIETLRRLHRGPGRPEVHYELVRDPWRQRPEAGVSPGLQP